MGYRRRAPVRKMQEGGNTDFAFLSDSPRVAIWRAATR
jgi:hypothetical protein